MLVYCTQVAFDPQHADIGSLVEVIARWIGQKSKSYVIPNDLHGGLRRRLSDGSTVESVAVTKADAPQLFAVSYAHGDSTVSGRQWITEIGLRQVTSGSPIECSVLLRTSEVSARVSAPVQASRPYVLAEMVKRFPAMSGTPGIKEHRLDENSAKAFLAAIEDPRRDTPFVIVSPRRDGSYVIAPPKLCSLTPGLADVVMIPPGADTFEIANLLGSKYSVWLGAISIVFPPRIARGGQFIDTVRLLPDDLDATTEEGGSPESEVLGALTHRLNLPKSWRHISVESVSREQFRAHLSSKLVEARKSADAHEYVALLEEADRELKDKDGQIEVLKQDIDRQQTEIWQRESEAEGLKAALSGRDGRRSASTTDVDILSDLRANIAAVVSGDPDLDQSLELIARLFPDRLVVLDSAFESAGDSRAFAYRRDAFNLLWTLATKYWEALDASQSDNDARKVFGNKAYSAKEAETLPKNGERRRTFAYKGQDIFMPKHLKIGVKDSVAETLRVHFHWDGIDKKIVIGHCGKHLDF